MLNPKRQSCKTSGEWHNESPFGLTPVFGDTLGDTLYPQPVPYRALLCSQRIPCISLKYQALCIIDAQTCNVLQLWKIWTQNPQAARPWGSIPPPGTKHVYIQWFDSAGHTFFGCQSVQYDRSFMNQIPNVSKRRGHTVFNLFAE